jgi:hypothetical protein
VTRDEQETVAFEMIQEAFAEMAEGTMDIGFRLHADGIDYTSEDVTAVVALIKEGWEMFHEIWSMGG